MRHRTNAVDIMVVLVFTAMQYLYVRATASIRDNYTGPACELPREPQSYTSTSNLTADRRDKEPPQMLPLRRPPASRARTHHLLLQRAPDAPTRTGSVSKPLLATEGKQHATHSAQNMCPHRSAVGESILPWHSLHPSPRGCDAAGGGSGMEGLCSASSRDAECRCLWSSTASEGGGDGLDGEDEDEELGARRGTVICTVETSGQPPMDGNNVAALDSPG